MKRAIYTKVEQFLRDDEFIRYVMDCEPDKESYWASYLTAAPEIRTAYLKAYDILMHLDDCDLLTPEQAATLKQRVMHTLRSIAIATPHSAQRSENATPHSDQWSENATPHSDQWSEN